MDQLARRYLCLERAEETLEYLGRENSELDRPVSVAEFEYELGAMKKGTAPGPDTITAKLLYNLEEGELGKLVNHFNEHYWARGVTPACWKTADIRFIPKPKKNLNLENLRPISLTSCVGKAFERVLNTRLMRYLEKENLMPHTQFGFRPRTSTQDILLWIYKDLLENPSRGQTRCILALDLKGAFDNVSHASVLRGLNEIHCGQRTFEYVRSFLTDRKATLTLGSMKPNSFELGSKGTPQGAVLSPLLFNLALRGLPEALGAVPGVEHAIYADDITLWCREVNDAEIEERLQAAAKIVEDYAEECGLKCAPVKSELLVLRNPYERVSEQIEVWVSGKWVSKPTQIRILGQLIRQGRGNKSTINKLDTMTTQLKMSASTKNGAWLMDKLGMAVPGGTHTGTVPDHELSAEIRKKIVVLGPVARPSQMVWKGSRHEEPAVNHVHLQPKRRWRCQAGRRQKPPVPALWVLEWHRNYAAPWMRMSSRESVGPSPLKGIAGYGQAWPLPTQPVKGMPSVLPPH
ncbi:hypothetical protein ISCGN_003983 [Ixodes scapularis]